MTDHRPDIPEPMKREVRQRCGFGCVICGLPLYEYEHMEGWANVKRHVASEITLLCDRHHREKTNGLLPVEKVREGDRSPYNYRAGMSPSYGLHYAGNECSLVAGGCEFKRTGLVEGSAMIAFAIDAVPLLAFHFEQGQLLLTLQVFDDDSKKILWIEKNELRYHPDPWDIRLEGRTLSVRETNRRYLLEVVFEPPSRITVQRGHFILNGLEIIVSPKCICYVNSLQLMYRVGIEGFDVAISAGKPFNAGLVVFQLPETNRGAPDRAAAKKLMRQVDA